MLQMVGRARREGVERIARLQRKYGSSKDPQDLAETLVQVGCLSLLVLPVCAEV